MKLEEYKEQLEKNELKSNIFIFKCKDKNSSSFLFHQYLNKYISSNGMSIENIEDISELYDNSLFSVSIDKITSNLWIKCSKVSKKINDNIVIELPKLEEWHIKDYINFNLPSAGDNLKEKLFLNYKANPFRLELEIEKIKCFDSYEDLEDQLFVDSTEYTVFDISNSLLRRDFNGLEKIKYNLNVIDVDPFGLLAILLKNFRYVIDIQLAKNSTPEYVGVSSKQFWAIKNYSCGHYTKDELVYIYKLLLSIDNKIKSGDIPINMVIDYIICKILLI